MPNWKTIATTTRKDELENLFWKLLNCVHFQRESCDRMIEEARVGEYEPDEELVSHTFGRLTRLERLLELVGKRVPEAMAELEEVRRDMDEEREAA